MLYRFADEELMKPGFPAPSREKVECMLPAKNIKDPVHGDIEVCGLHLRLLDAPVIQRLRYIRQLGFSYLVYPGANHTRFEHSLGTLHLADLICRHLDLDDDERLLITSAALLHDIGHGPFSHAIEPLMEDCLHQGHQDIGMLLSDDRTGALLDEFGIDPGGIVRVVAGNHPLSGIIYGDLDVDRMDYLLRDAHYTGAPYGTVDAHRLIRNTLVTEDGRIVLHESGINAAESLLLARTLMRPAVYFHHVSRIAESMFLAAVYAHIRRRDTASAAEIIRMDDSACMQALLTSDQDVTRTLARRIYTRELYKRALYVGKEQVHPASLKEFRTVEQRSRIATEIAEGAGLLSHEVLVDIPPFPHAMSMDVQVKNRHQVVGLEEVSPLMNTLNETRQGQWRLGVYTLPADVGRVAEVAAEVLHIRPVTLQETLQL